MNGLGIESSDTSTIRNRFRYRKYNLWVYFGIKTGIGID